MQSDIESLCKRARASIPIPLFPLAAIRQAQAQGSRRPIKRRKGAFAGVLAGLSIVAVAAAAEIWNGAHIVVHPRAGVQLSADTGSMVLKDPTQGDVDAAIRKVSFPVTLPAGLPEGARFKAIVRFGSGALMMQYDLPGAWRRSNHLFMLILADPKSVGSAGNLAHHRYKINLQLGGIAGTGSVQWRIGGENVIVPNSTITSAELARIKQAMMKKARF